MPRKPYQSVRVKRLLADLERLQGRLCCTLDPNAPHEYWIEPGGLPVPPSAARIAIREGVILPEFDALFPDLTQTWKKA